MSTLKDIPQSAVIGLGIVGGLFALMFGFIAFGTAGEMISGDMFRR